MKELKFRAWNFLTEQMIYGEPVHVYPNGVIEVGGYDTEGDPDEGPTVSVMQYTGLKDKNGKEIYEGDIVKFASFGGHYQVEFRDGAFEPRLGHAREVIGNIYENPELLSGKV